MSEATSMASYLVRASISILAIFFLYSSSAKAQVRSVSSEVIAELKTSIVPVACVVGPIGNKTVSVVQGTAAFINGVGDILTPAHVAAIVSSTSLSPRGDCTYAVYVPNDGWGIAIEPFDAQFFGIGSCDIDQPHDIAACHLLSNPFQNPIISKKIRTIALRSKTIDDGSEIAFTGFPLQNKRSITSKGDIAAQHVTSEGVSSGIVLDRAAWPGASGSMVYTADGLVVGMVIRTGVREGEGLSYAVPASQLIEFLTTRSIPFTRH